MDLSTRSPRRAPIFLDETGRRWRRLRRAALVVGIITTVVAAITITMVVIPPLLPEIPLTGAPFARAPGLATSKIERERLSKKLQLYFSLRKNRVPGVRANVLPVRGRTVPGRVRAPGAPIVAGFYVTWDDNSLDALLHHADDLDWVVCECAWLGPNGNGLRMRIDRRVGVTIASAVPDPKLRPQIFIMVSNFDSATKRWDPVGLRHLLTNPAARALALKQLTDSVAFYGMGGVTIDFEEEPQELTESITTFVSELRKRLVPMGKIVTQAASVNDSDHQLAKFAAVNDYLFLMLYDEHFGKTGDPGPIASQQWFVERMKHMLRFVPAQKAIPIVGAYGYDWNDGDSTTNGQQLTFQEIMSAVRKADKKALHFDSTTLNPYATWTDRDSTEHLAWYLDAITAYNQTVAAQALGTAGMGIWRMGSEDPAIWRVIGKSGIDSSAALLSVIPPGYDAEMEGNGEILDLFASPDSGNRTVRIDPKTKLVVDEVIHKVGTPYIVNRYGSSDPHLITLTFDDGPDGKWTPMILDTLKSRGVTGTFFLIGENAERHLPLLRRIVNEGHLIGNHTFLHPNLAFTSDKRTKLELDATERLFEAVLGRRTAFFRPPYFGDAEPTTLDELVPAQIAKERGYLIIGLHIDAEDWQSPGVKTIIDTVLAQRSRGNVVLLHDGGGDRSQTVAALGPLIDTLRALGDTVVPLSQLIGLTRDQAMPGLPPRNMLARAGELIGWGTLSLVQWLLYWIFFLAIFLGFARLVFMTILAIIQHVKNHQNRDAPITFAPSVSVIVPAYKEEKVILRTIETLVAQEYPGELEVVVVDDGSPDETYQVAHAAYGDHPKVRVYRKPNGGKASVLNYGLAYASGEIVICLDADTLFAPDTVAELVEPLHDPKVGAVAGNAKVGNRINLVTRWQAIEYVTSQNLDRRAFSLLNCITVVPGAVGAWRKSLVQKAGGFSEDTLAEDQDLTLSIRRRGFSIAYADEAIGYTEAPDTLGGLAKQRFRWSFGTLQCLWKHRRTFFHPRYGLLGFVALPNVLLFQIIYPFLSPIADLMFVLSLWSAWAIREAHGATYAMTSVEQVLTYYAVFLIVDWLASILAFTLEPDEDKWLTWLIFLQRFAYRQVMYWVVVRSVFAALRGRLVGWGKLERKATVELETATSRP